MADNENIYGIKYEVDIEELKTSTKEASNQIKLANSEFNKAQSGLDNWATSVEGVSAKVDQLNTILKAQKSQLAQSKQEYNNNVDSLKKYDKQIEEAKASLSDLKAEFGESSKEYKTQATLIDKLEREQSALKNTTDRLKISINNQQATVNKTEKSLNHYEAELKDVQTAQKNAEKSGNSLEDELKDLKKSAEKTTDSVEAMGDGFSVVKGAIANLIANGISAFIGGIKNAVEESREFRTELGKLQATAITVGASFDTAKDNLKEVASITNDTGAGVEGLNNLLSAGFDGKALDDITDQLLGASIKWKDTLKFEGLSDGLQETLATGNATGPFAEMIERAGGSLDNFNAGLNEAIKNGDEQNYVLEYLSQYGLTDVKKTYEETNKSLIDSANAGYDYQLAMAKVGETVEPVLTALKQGFADLLLSLFGVTSFDLSPLTNGIKGAFSTIQGLITGDISIDKAMGSVLDSINNLLNNFIPSLIQKGTEFIGNLGQGIQESIPDLISSALDILDNFANTLTENVPILIESGIEFIRNLVQGLMEALPEFIARAPEIISKFANVINENAPKIIEGGFNIIMDLIKGIINAIPTLIANIPQIINAILDVWSAFNWLKLGQDAIKFIGDGFTAMIDFVKNSMSNVNTNIINAIKNLPNTLLNLGKQAISFLSSGISNMVNTAVTAITNLGNSVINGAKSVLNINTLLQVGKDLITGLWNGISNMTGWIMDKIGGFANDVVNGIKDFFGIHSPSKETEWIGEMLSKGLGIGIEKLSGYALDKANSLSSDVLNALMTDLDDLNMDLSANVNRGVNGLKMASGANGNVNNVTFNQYNTSPKAIDSTQTYLNTRKLLNQFKLWEGAKA